MHCRNHAHLQAKVVISGSSSFTVRVSPVQEHQRGGGAEQAEAEAGPGPRRRPEEEGRGQDAAREGQTVQTRPEREGEEAHAEGGAQEIKPTGHFARGGGKKGFVMRQR